MYGYVYMTRDIVSGEIYIGQHKSKSYDPSYLGSGKILKRKIKKHGASRFENGIIMRANSKEELDSYERFCIELAKKKFGKLCINIAKGGDGGDVISGLSEKDREKFVKKMTMINLIRCNTGPFKRSISNAGKHRYESQEERDKQSDRIRSAWSDKALREAQSERLRGYYSTRKKDNSYNNKACVFELNGIHKEFTSVTDLRKFLIDSYGYNPDRRTFKRLMKDGANRIGFEPFHKKKHRALTGMLVYYK